MIDGKKPPKPWTRRQYDFAMEYLANGGNATEAAKKAKFSQKTAYRTGADILKKPQFKHVQDFIASKTQAVMEKVQVTVEDVLTHQLAMAHSDIADFLEVDDTGQPRINVFKTPHATKAVSSIKIKEHPAIEDKDGKVLKRAVIETEIKLWDKPKTNEALMKNLGLLAPDPAPAGDTNIQNVFVNADPVDVMKRIALLLYRGGLPKVPQTEGGGSSSGISAKSPTGDEDKG